MWRVGHKVPINVYDGDRPVCQCHNEEDAQLIVECVNAEIDDTYARLHREHVEQKFPDPDSEKQ